MNLCMLRKAYTICGVNACSKNAVLINTAIQYFRYVCEGIAHWLFRMKVGLGEAEV